MQNPRLTPARVEVQGSSHQATVWGQPYRYRLPGQRGSVKIILSWLLIPETGCLQLAGTAFLTLM